MPKVLIADKLSPAAVAIFKERGVDIDNKPGMTKEELLAVVDQYDGIAIRSATKITADVIKAAKKLKWIHHNAAGPDNCVDVSPQVKAGRLSSFADCCSATSDSRRARLSSMRSARARKLRGSNNHGP